MSLPLAPSATYTVSPGDNVPSGTGYAPGEPVRAQRIRIRMPQGRKAKKVQFLVGSAVPQVLEANGYVTLTVPSILDHQVIAIDI